MMWTWTNPDDMITHNFYVSNYFYYPYQGFYLCQQMNVVFTLEHLLG